MDRDLRLLLRIEDSLLQVEARVGLLARVSAQVAPGETQRFRRVLDSPCPSPGDLALRRSAGESPRRGSHELGCSEWSSHGSGGWERGSHEQGRSERQRATGVLAAAELALGHLRSEVRAQLLEERVAELRLELRLLSEERRRERTSLCRSRFSAVLPHLDRARSLAQSWLSKEEGDDPVPSPSVDLASELIRLCRAEGIDVLVRSADILSRAAVGDDCLFVQRGCKVDASEARRIYVHEVHGHLLVRRRARDECDPPGRVGSSGADIDEEGRAVFLEEAAGLLGPVRRRQLAIRHLLADAAFAGGSSERLAECAIELGRRGLPSAPLAEALVRAERGFGFVRDIIYLPGFLRLREASEESGVLERLSKGRFSLEAARCLEP